MASSLPRLCAVVVPPVRMLLSLLFIYSFIWLCGTWTSGCCAWTPEHTGLVVAALGLNYPEAHGILVPQLQIEPVSPVLPGGFLATGLPGKSPDASFSNFMWLTPVPPFRSQPKCFSSTAHRWLLSSEVILQCHSLWISLLYLFGSMFYNRLCICWNLCFVGLNTI